MHPANYSDLNFPEFIKPLESVNINQSSPPTPRHKGNIVSISQ